MTAEHSGATPVAAKMIRGAAAQQGAQVAAVLAGLVTATALGRSLSVPEFGSYGLVVSFALYVAFLNLGASTIASRWLGAATIGSDNGRIAATVLAYAIAVGMVVAAVFIAFAELLVPVLSLPDALRGAAQDGTRLLAAVHLVGIPLRATNDVLRGNHQFGLAAACEGLGFLAWGALLSAAVLWLDAELPVLIAIGGSVSLFIGCFSVAALLGLRRSRLEWGRPTAETVRAFTRESLGAGLGSASTVAALAADRIVLISLASTVALGLYEAVIRVFNLVLQVNSGFVRNVTPMSSRLHAEGDQRREAILALSGTKFLLIVMLPPVGSACILAEPLLVTWLGQPYEAASTALTILLAGWLVSLSAAVLGGMLYARGLIGELARMSWIGALINLGISLALTPLLGLEGPVIGTAVGMLYIVPRILRLARRVFGDQLAARALARSWGPVYLAQVPPLAGLAAIRWISEPAAGLPTLLLLVASVAAGWAISNALVISEADRDLLRASRQGRPARP